MKEYEFEITLEKITVYGFGDDEEEALRDAEDTFCRDYLTKDIEISKVVVKSVGDCGV